MHINIGDKLVVVKNLTGFFDIGDVVNVNGVENNLISFTFDNNLSKSGQMDFNTCEKYFEKAEEVKSCESLAITEEYIMSIMEESEFEVFTTFDKCTVVSCRLPNGFVITEYSACVSPEGYDEDLGAEICFDKIANKVWELEAYRLQHELYEGNAICYCENCDGCPCEDEFDECLDTDLDCDDCDDADCHFRAR